MTVPAFAKDYRRPDLADVRAQVDRLAQRCRDAGSADDTVACLREWNDLRCDLDTQYNVAMVRYAQNTADGQAKAEQDFWDSAAPTVRELDVAHARAILDSPHRDAIAAAFGEQLVALKECMANTFAPQIKDAIAEEAKLCSEYTQLGSKTELEFRGERYSMSGISVHFLDADRQVRLEAQQARDRFLDKYSDQLDSLYDRLVGLRHSMGTALGHDNFIPLGYQLMSRTSYGPDEVATFRDAVRAEFVPIATALFDQRRNDLGVDTLMFHDEPVMDKRGNPRPTGNPQQILTDARTMYHELGDDFGQFIDVLLDRDLVDVELRDGKAPGGFCTVFANTGMPFVFTSFNGSEDDIAVVTHEFGHAFQVYSSRVQSLLEYKWPTMEAAEIHSMSMEFLTYPWMERFFADDADRYRRAHLIRILSGRLPYTASVDHFQHEVYANPTMTPAERNHLWLDLEHRYVPHRNYGDLFPYISRGTYWQRQLHIYQLPFYYIDYALAQICALQFWQKAEQDRDAALKDYLAICDIGGSRSFAEILEIGNLRSPFDPDVIRDVAAFARKALD